VRVQPPDPGVVAVAAIDRLDDEEGESPGGSRAAFRAALADHVHAAVLAAAGDVGRWGVGEDTVDHLFGQGQVAVAQAERVQTGLAQHGARGVDLHGVPGMLVDAQRAADGHAQGLQIVDPAVLPGCGPVAAEQWGLRVEVLVAGQLPRRFVEGVRDAGGEPAQGIRLVNVAHQADHQRLGSAGGQLQNVAHDRVDRVVGLVEADDCPVVGGQVAAVDPPVPLFLRRRCPVGGARPAGAEGHHIPVGPDLADGSVFHRPVGGGHAVAAPVHMAAIAVDVGGVGGHAAGLRRAVVQFQEADQGVLVRQEVPGAHFDAVKRPVVAQQRFGVVARDQADAVRGEVLRAVKGNRRAAGVDGQAEVQKGQIAERPLDIDAVRPGHGPRPPAEAHRRHSADHAAAVEHGAVIGVVQVAEGRVIALRERVGQAQPAGQMGHEIRSLCGKP